MEAFFWGLNLLSKREWGTGLPGQGGWRCRVLEWVRRCWKPVQRSSREAECGKPAAQSGSGLSLSCRRALKTAPETIACFAPALIAAKSLKPCDGGVFQALNLLLKRE